MKRPLFCALAITTFLTVNANAQAGSEPARRPVKVVVTDSMPAVRFAATAQPRPVATPYTASEQKHYNADGAKPSPSPLPSVQAPMPARSQPAAAAIQPRPMSFSQIKNRIAEAKRQMQSRPIATAFGGSTAAAVATDLVRIAFQDSKTNQIDYVVLTKESFLNSKEEKFIASQGGRGLTIRTIRGNGVNTPISLVDQNGVVHTPLIVQYPVVRDGKYTETAYYVSTHNGLVTPEVVNAGKFYVRNVIEIARDRLKEKGVTIAPKIADIAERLATVEHVDHQRFKNEYHPTIFNDIFTLYALNEGQTYRYSVSSAGAGGMVQMIPATYRMMRSLYPQIGLMPDFVEGMRNHVNASQAMLLYINMTWNDLLSRPTIGDALATKIATPEQLMAAGYNSNPAKLSGYINRGGADWTNLIPKETQMYLRIYDSLEKFVPMTPRTR